MPKGRVLIPFAGIIRSRFDGYDLRQDSVAGQRPRSRSNHPDIGGDSIAGGAAGVKWRV